MIVLDAWTIDGTPPKWNILYDPSAIVALLPMEKRTLVRAQGEISVPVFVVVLSSGTKVSHAREITGAPYERMLDETEALRSHIVGVWARHL